MTAPIPTFREEEDRSLRLVAGPREARPRGRCTRWLQGCLGLALVSLAAARPVSAESEENPEYQYKVKAGFLYNFIKFVDWPKTAFPSTNSPIVIGLLEMDPAAPMLELQLQSKSVRGHLIQVRRFAAEEQPLECHLLFLSRHDPGRIAQVLNRLRGAPVLTVGETSDFARAGGMINFVMKGETLRFEINLEAAERVGLKISSGLANLATIVKTQD